MKLKVEVPVRFLEDSKLNGVSDVKGDMPCTVGGMWTPTIDLKTGQILNWKKGNVANIRYYVCDSGLYDLIDDENDENYILEDEYVPKMLSPKEEGYGDYIIMDIDKNGFIKDFDMDLSEFSEMF